MSLKVAVVGAGSMGTNHLRVLQDFDDDSFHLVGVADSQESTLARAVRRYHVAGFADHRRMVFETCPDLVVVAVPTNLHCKQNARFALGRYRRLKAHKQLPALRAALDANQNKISHGVLARQANAA